MDAGTPECSLLAQEKWQSGRMCWFAKLGFGFSYDVLSGAPLSR
jgi:hypothetical protein